MHLLLLTPHADEPIPEQSVLAACRQWLDLGHSIRLLSASPAGSQPIDRSVHLLPSDASRLAGGSLGGSANSPEGVWPRVRDWLSRAGGVVALIGRTTTAQGVHLVLADRPDLSAAVAAWTARFVRGWPVVTCIDSLPAACGVGVNGFWSHVAANTARWLQNRLLHSSSTILVKDDDSSRELISRGVPACRITIIPESLSLKEMPLRRARFEYRRLFDSTERWVLGAILPGNSQPDHHAFLLDASELFQNRGPSSVVFWIVAAGDQRLALEREARCRGLRNVRFVANVPTSALPDFISSCDGWLHLQSQPKYELLMPALAMNVPVIVPNSLRGVDRIIDADAGLPMIEGDPESLIDCILELQDHPQGCRQGRAFVAAHHDADALTARTLEVLLQSALPETLPLAAPEPAVASEPDRTWKDAA